MAYFLVNYDFDNILLKTIGNNVKIVDLGFCVNDSYLQKGERCLFVDDFLANGNAALGILDIASQAGAEVVGMAFLIEKGFQAGGKLLREKGIHIESLAIIESLDNREIKIKD